MEVYESFSRAVLRRRYRRIDTGGSRFAVKLRRRFRVAHLEQQDDGVKRSRVAHRQRLACFHLRLRLVPGSLAASLKTAWVKLVEQVAAPSKPVLALPSKMPLRSSNGDVVNDAWFQHALRRSIAEGRLTI